MTTFAQHSAQFDNLKTAVATNDHDAIRTAANVILDAPRAPTYYVSKTQLTKMLNAMKKNPSVNVARELW